MALIDNYSSSINRKGNETAVYFQAACDTFGVNDESASQVVSDTLKNMTTGWFPGLYRWVQDRRKNVWDLCSSKS